MQPIQPRGNGMSGPKWQLDDDLQTVSLTFPRQLPATMKINARELEILLQTLGTLRSRISPPVPDVLPLPAQLPTIQAPQLLVDSDIATGRIFLDLQDARFGWQRIDLSVADANGLAMQIIGRVAALAKGRQG